MHFPAVLITSLFSISLIQICNCHHIPFDLPVPGHSHECVDTRKEFISCQSTGCIRTCANPSPIDCTLDCAHGCFCRDDYVLDETTENCTTVAECTTLCRANEEYRECQMCEPTCRQPEQQATCRDGCAPTGKGSCFCAVGFVRNSIGLCIKPEQCS